MLDIKPCPFCGSAEAPEVHPPLMEDRSGTSLETMRSVICNRVEKGCGSSSGYYISAIDAIEGWNRRARQGGGSNG